MTGRGAGYCADYNTLRYLNIVTTRLGCGRGRGFFAFRRFVIPMKFGYPVFYTPAVEYPLSKEEGVVILKNEISALEREHMILKDEMENLSIRLNELKAQKIETE